MVEFAINNSVHASTKHTPFYVNGLRHPRISALLDCDSSSRRGGTHSSRKRSGSCSSPIDETVNAKDSDVDLIDIDEHRSSNSNDAIVDSDDDAGIFSIANDYASESDDALTDEETHISAVRTGRTVNKNIVKSADDFLLTREAVVRFIQDSIANAVDRQKRNADKNGRANVLSFKVNDLVVLSTVNLPKHVVTNVGSNKLLPKYIGPFRVLHRQGNAYTIELPRRMRTHPTFHVGRLRPYCQYAASYEGEDNFPSQEPQPGSCVRESVVVTDSAAKRSRRTSPDFPSRVPTRHAHSRIGRSPDPYPDVDVSPASLYENLRRDQRPTAVLE